MVQKSHGGSIASYMVSLEKAKASREWRELSKVKPASLGIPQAGDKVPYYRSPSKLIPPELNGLGGEH